MRERLAVAWLVLQLATVPAIAAEPACARPKAIDMLEQSRAAIGETDPTVFLGASAIFLPATAGRQRIQWMAASWEAPPGGALFVLDCSGRRLASLALGAVDRLQAGPRVPDVGPTVEARYISEYGTGALGRSIRLVAFVDNAIIGVWDHMISESASAPSLEVEYTDTFRWRLAPDGTAIVVNGMRKVGGFPDRDHGWAADTTHKLPRERFCWLTSAKNYTACAP